MRIKKLLATKWALIIAFTVPVLLSSNLGTVKTYAAEQTTISAPATRTINITGDGEVTVAPDTAYLYLGVVTEKTTVAEAQSANSAIVNNLIEAIKKEGVKEEEIQTSSYNISPRYEYDRTTEKSVLVGYTVSYSLNVTVKDISKVGAILDTAVNSGANISRGLSFGVSDYEKYYNTALVNALSNAQEKAQAISNFLGVKLDAPVKITENSNGVFNDYPVYYSSMNAKFESSVSSVSTSVQAGTYKIKASVSVTYEY